MAKIDLRLFASFGRKIVAVGRNYREHAAELGNVVPSKPLLFLKPPSSYIQSGEAIIVPDGCTELHHEVELGLVIGESGSRIAERAAMDHVGGYALALDMTARDLQSVAKSKGHPWTVAKGFDTFCPISRFVAKTELPDPQNTRLWLKVDGATRQDGTTRDMIFSIPSLVSYISHIMTLERGDVILTGTPAGVGPVKPGQRIRAGIEDVMEVEYSVESRKID